MRKNTKRVNRQKDLVVRAMPRLFKGKTHSAYYWMRKVKEGVMPPGNTNVRKALDAIELTLIQDFGELNGCQQVEMNLLRPLLAWWLLYPGVGEDGTLAHDFKWVHGKIEDGLKRVRDLADKDLGGQDLYDQWRTEFLKEREQHDGA
jgi:hypothetical protein